MKDPYIVLAEKTIENYIRLGKKIKLPEDLPIEFYKKKAGVFVSLHHKVTDELLGCIGTYAPTQSCLAKEIINNAISAAMADPRFEPITKEQLSELKISVDILSPLDKIKDINELNPKKYGIYIISNDGRSALLLPDLEGVSTVEDQISITRQKGSIDIDEPITIYRFTVDRH
jgi:hypothetical protein